MHIETIAWSATQPNTGGAAATVVSAANSISNTLTIKNSKSEAELLCIWAHNQVDGFHQLTYPTAHDTTRGIRMTREALSVTPLIPMGMTVPVQPQEVLSVLIAGSNTAGDVETGVALVGYKDLPGVTSRLIGFPEAQRNIIAITTIQATITGTAAGWSGAELITAESDLLRANRDYCILGGVVSTRCAAIGIHGPDTGYQTICFPGEPSQAESTGQWFSLLSRMLDRPCIPVFNSGNRSATFIDVLDNENFGAIGVSLTLGLLK